MALQSSWDQRKAQSNAEKHSISFEEAASAFGDPLSLTVEDPDHSRGEKGIFSLGKPTGVDWW
jgi:uncharacterized protein